MILGLHEMFHGVARYWNDHMSSEGSWWILGLDALLLVPLIFAVFFYPMVVLIGVGAAAILTVGFMWLTHVADAHRHHVGHH